MGKTDSRIGFVGVGRMGANMARRLKDQGETIVAVYDLDLATATNLASELGCEAAASPARVAELANIVFTVVSDDAAMRQIFSATDTESLLRHAKDRLFVNCATLSPTVHMEVDALVTQRGGQSLEACMASSITQARQGTLYLMCGGNPDVFESVKPLLEKLSRREFRSHVVSPRRPSGPKKAPNHSMISARARNGRSISPTARPRIAPRAEKFDAATRRE